MARLTAQEIAFIVPADGGASQLLYMRDSTVVKISSENGRLVTVFELPTTTDISTQLQEWRRINGR